MYNVGWKSLKRISDGDIEYSAYNLVTTDYVLSNKSHNSGKTKVKTVIVDTLTPGPFPIMFCAKYEQYWSRSNGS